MTKKRKSLDVAQEVDIQANAGSDLGNSDSDSSSDDSLVLEGELIRNPDADVSDDDDGVTSEEENSKSKGREPSKKKPKQQQTNLMESKAKKTSKNPTNEPETIQVEL